MVWVHPVVRALALERRWSAPVELKAFEAPSRTLRPVARCWRDARPPEGCFGRRSSSRRRRTVIRRRTAQAWLPPASHAPWFRAGGSSPRARHRWLAAERTPRLAADSTDWRYSVDLGADSIGPKFRCEKQNAVRASFRDGSGQRS